MIQISDFMKVPYLPFFDLWSNMRLCPLFQSSLFRDFSVRRKLWITLLSDWNSSLSVNYTNSGQSYRYKRTKCWELVPAWLFIICQFSNVLKFYCIYHRSSGISSAQSAGHSGQLSTEELSQLKIGLEISQIFQALKFSSPKPITLVLFSFSLHFLDCALQGLFTRGR